MRIRVNGREEEISEGTRLVAFLEEKGIDRRYLLVEHNGDALAREGWDEVVLSAGDRLELVRPVAGG
jgi:thiamine biosynthesis protein ThiS